MNGIAYVPAFETPGLVIDDLLWDDETSLRMEVGPPTLTDERRLVDSALSRTSTSIEGTPTQIEILRLKTTAEWKVFVDVQFEAPINMPPTPTWIELAQLVFSGSRPLSQSERAELNDANRPFARPVGVVRKKHRSF
jgi:hypothetical protein